MAFFIFLVLPMESGTNKKANLAEKVKDQDPGWRGEERKLSTHCYLHTYERPLLC